MIHDPGTTPNTRSSSSENALDLTGLGKTPANDPDAWMAVLKIDSVLATPDPRIEESRKAWLHDRAHYPAMGVCRR